MWFISLTEGGRLRISFASTAFPKAPITGLVGGEPVVAIDFRPATGTLYALSGGSRLYSIDTTTGTATQVGAAGAASVANFTVGIPGSVDIRPRARRRP